MLRSSSQLKKLAQSFLKIQTNSFKATATQLQDSSKRYDEWKKISEAQLKGKTPETLIWETPEVRFFQ
jgi:hypothetical protein